MINLQYIRTSTLLLRWNGLTVLTDPWFAMHMRGLPVFVKPCVHPRDLPRLDLVLVSHLHPDHFDRRALSLLTHRCRVLIGPPQLRGKVRDLPVDRRVFLAHGEQARVPGFSVTAYSVQHSGYENAYLLERDGESLLFAGDANFSPVFQDIGLTHAPQVSLLPVGGTIALGRRIVMGPEDAFAAAVCLRTKVVVPTHLGGEWMSVPPLSLHPGRGRHLVALARQAGAEFTVAALRPGQSVTVEQGRVRRPSGRPKARSHSQGTDPAPGC